MYKQPHRSLTDVILSQIYHYDPTVKFNFQELGKNLNHLHMSDLYQIRMKADHLAKEANTRMKEVIAQYSSFIDDESFESALNFHVSYSNIQDDILDFINKFLVTKLRQLGIPHTVFFAENNKIFFSWCSSNAELDDVRNYRNGPF